MKRKPRRGSGVCIVSASVLLIVVVAVGVAATKYAVGQYALLAAAAASNTQRCFGGEAFVYSGDFSDMPNSSNNPPEVVKFTCYQSEPLGNGALRWIEVNSATTLHFKESQTLNSAKVCALVPPSNPSACAVAYYAVIPNYQKSQSTFLASGRLPSDFNPLRDIPSKLEGGRCVLKGTGATVQFADCIQLENTIRSNANAQEKSFCRALPYLKDSSVCQASGVPASGSTSFPRMQQTPRLSNPNYGTALTGSPAGAGTLTQWLMNPGSLSISPLYQGGSNFSPGGSYFPNNVGGSPSTNKINGAMINFYMSF